MWISSMRISDELIWTAMRISGNEAVAFFQGSGLPKQVLAQVSVLSRSSLLMCQISWHLQNRNHHQFRMKGLPQLRVQQLLLHLKLILSQKSLKVWMPRFLKMEQHMIKMGTSRQEVLRTVHLPAVLFEAHLENFQILTMEGQQTQMPHPVIRNLKVMIMRVLDLCFLATKVPMNQHGGHLTRMMTLTWCGVSMQLVSPRRVTRITTFLALGSLGSTLSGLGQHKEVAFPRRAALLLSTILFLAHHSQPSIQGIHRQGIRIAQNLHLTPSLGLIHSDVTGQSNSKKRIRFFWVFSKRHLGHHLTVKLQEETQTQLGPLHLGHHSMVKLLEETRTHLGLQGLSGRHWRLREMTLIIGVYFCQVVALVRFCVCFSSFQAFIS